MTSWHVLGHDDVDTGQAETVHTACYSTLLLTAMKKKTPLFSKQLLPLQQNKEE
jgi:hypothetical protein